MTILADRLSEAMKAQELNRADVAQVLKCSPQRIGHLRNGFITLGIQEVAALHKAGILDGHKLLDEYLAA